MAAGALLLKRGQVKKIVYFRDGYPILVKSNLLSECLGRVLVRERMITEAECETSLKKMKESQKQQGTVLIEMGCISPHNLTYGLQLQLEAKLYEVFAWTDGEFRFNPRSDVATPTTGLDLPAARIIYEGVRRSYDEARLKKALGDVEALPVARSTDPLYRFQDIGMDGEETELWHRIDGRRTVKELVAGGPLEREDALKFLYALLCVQMVEIAPEAQLVEEEEPEEAEEAPGGEPVPTPPSLELEERLARERLLARLQDLKRQTYFEVLGIAPAAAGTGVRKAFFALAKEHHPDRYAARSPEVRAIAGEIFALLTTAHDTLTDAEARKRYEEELKRAPPESDADRASRILAADREFRRGEGLLEAHLAQDAMEAFEKAVSLYPEEAEFHAFLGWAVHLARREDAEQAQRALGHLSKAVELNPRLDRGHLFLSRVHRALGHATEAEAALERALQANPDSAEAQRELRGSAPTAGP
jgi:curved DNA-binding protein CbpA